MIAENLKRIRTEKGLSMNWLAAQANISAEYIRRVEAGMIKSPGIDNLNKIAEVLKVDLGELLKGK